MAVCTTAVSGTKRWHLNGEYHREDGPAVEFANGSKHWCQRGKLHREDGPAVDHIDGDKFWYSCGMYHREDGPAIEYADGTKYWYLNDNRHRLDGPAIERADGIKQWFFEGRELTEEQHSRIRERIERAEKARAHRIKWFILDRLLPKLCSPNNPAFLKRFHADWDAASSE